MPAELTDLEARVADRLRATAVSSGQAPPETDAAMQGVARMICQQLSADGVPRPGLIEFAMRHHGLVDPPPLLLVIPFFPSREQGILDRVVKRLATDLASGQYNRMGIARGPSSLGSGPERLVVTLVPSSVRLLRPVPRQLRLGQQAVVVAELADRFAAPRRFVVGPGGQVDTGSIDVSPGQPIAAVTCRERGVYRVEVLGDGHHGVEVMANFPIYCQQPPPSDPSAVGSSARAALPERIEDIEQQLFAWTNSVRQAAGLAPLTHDPVVAQVAREHSNDMREAGFVGHVSPTMGRPEDRLQRAAVPHLLVRENVARGHSLQEVKQQLMDSPAHHSTMLSQDVTRLGVGVAVDQTGGLPAVLVTQELIQPATAVDPAAAPQQIRTFIAELRTAAGLPPLGADPALDRIAQDFLEAVVGPNANVGQARQRLSQATRRHGGRYVSIDSVRVGFEVLEALSQSDDLRSADYTHLGLGVTVSGGQATVMLLLAVGRRP